jgi:hypothetical protein
MQLLLLLALVFLVFSGLHRGLLRGLQALLLLQCCAGLEGSLVLLPLLLQPAVRRVQLVAVVACAQLCSVLAGMIREATAATP